MPINSLDTAIGAELQKFETIATYEVTNMTAAALDAKFVPEWSCVVIWAQGVAPEVHGLVQMFCEFPMSDSSSFIMKIALLANRSRLQGRSCFEFYKFHNKDRRLCYARIF